MFRSDDYNKTLASAQYRVFVNCTAPHPASRYDPDSNSCIDSMACRRLPPEIWHQILNHHFCDLLSNCEGQPSTCTCTQTFDDRARQYLLTQHGLISTWDLPAWQHLAKHEITQLFELRLVCHAFARPLLGVMMSGLMIPAGSPIASRFYEVFGKLKNLPVRSLECIHDFPT